MKTFIIISVLLAFAYAKQPNYNTYRAPTAQHSSGGSGSEIPILRSESDIQADGHYSYSYETGNGIQAQESGVGGASVSGSASWTAPDGTPVQFSYIADENGYQPNSALLPTPPPVPDYILRALEYIRTHPYQEVQHPTYKVKAAASQQAYKPPAQPAYKPPAYKPPTSAYNKNQRKYRKY